ncbi:Uncharacterised protein [Mycobacteroides abscessus subsp. abscessus]|nr:Uncharacterised protein [Mycobacteroides abscessus subsp. abscessus]
MCWKALAANAVRCASVNPPARTAASTATDGWFFAAARTIDGPPISICSTHSSGLAPLATVWVNG